MRNVGHLNQLIEYSVNTALRMGDCSSVVVCIDQVSVSPFRMGYAPAAVLRHLSIVSQGRNTMHYFLLFIASSEGLGK